MTKSSEKVAQSILVDAGKLSQGLKTTFEGVAMIFDSLGVEADIAVPEVAEKKSSPRKKTEKQDEPKTEDPAEEETDQEAGNENADATDDAAFDDAGSASDGSDEVTEDDSDKAAEDGNEVAEEPEQASEETPEEESEEKPKKKAAPVSTVTLDDVTKIIVQKIKQDRSNNEKIGQILKTYGATKVGELDEAKYEAFLTDIAAL